MTTRPEPGAEHGRPMGRPVEGVPRRTLDQALRYHGVVELLSRHRASEVLEVGSGSSGLAAFWAGQVTGLDLRFDGTPLPNPDVVEGSALDLPFDDRSFEAVVLRGRLRAPAEGAPVAGLLRASPGRSSTGLAGLPGRGRRAPDGSGDRPVGPDAPTAAARMADRAPRVRLPGLEGDTRLAEPGISQILALFALLCDSCRRHHRRACSGRHAGGPARQLERHTCHAPVGAGPALPAGAVV